MRALGCDPGTANCGIVVLEYYPGTKPVVLHAEHVNTIPADNVQVAESDLMRLRVLYDSLDRIIRQYQPDVIAAEVYTVYTKFAAKDGWKTRDVYAAVALLAHRYDIPFRPFLPQDLKRKVAQRSPASKDDVARAVLARVAGLEAYLCKVARSRHEHLTDACAIALLGLATHVQAEEA